MIPIRGTKNRILLVPIIILLLYTITKNSVFNRFEVSFPTVALPPPIPKLPIIDICITPNSFTTPKVLTPLFKKSRPLECDKNEEDWVICKRSECFVKEIILKKDPNVTCTFTEVLFRNDFRLVHGASKSGIVVHTLNMSDVVSVYCKSQNKTWSSVLLGFRNLTRLQNTSDHYDHPVNVIILGFASVSKNTFINKLPLTYKYLINTLDGNVLRGYNIVENGSDSSSLYPFLTGLSKDELFNSYIPRRETYINTFPFIWKEFIRKGYVTAYLEDSLLWASPIDKFQGFLSMPTHHYIKSYYLATRWKMRVWSRFCSGSIPRHRIIMNYMKNFLTTYETRGTFLFSFQGELSYYDFNTLDILDNDLVYFLKVLKELDIFEKTLLIVMSDQGTKFPTLKYNLHAKQEELTPFLYIRLPPVFTKKYLRSYGNFKRNIQTLTTPFDVYSTLKHVLEPRTYTRASNRSISLFHKIRSGRSCANAEIDPAFCSCMIKKNITNTTVYMHQLKNDLEFSLNKMTRYFRDKCAELTVLSISSLIQIVPNAGFDYYETDIDHFLISAVVLPGYTVFETAALYDRKRKKFAINTEDTVSYEYELQSMCLRSHPKLRKYCYCRDQLLY